MTGGYLPLLRWPWVWFERASAMHGALQVTTPWGLLVVQPPAGRWRWLAYLSPNGTPWAATWAVGPGLTAGQKQRARVHRALWGHGYDPVKLDPQILGMAIDVAELRSERSLADLHHIVRQRFDWTSEAACVRVH